MADQVADPTALLGFAQAVLAAGRGSEDLGGDERGGESEEQQGVAVRP